MWTRVSCQSLTTTTPAFHLTLFLPISKGKKKKKSPFIITKKIPTKKTNKIPTNKSNLQDQGCISISFYKNQKEDHLPLESFAIAHSNIFTPSHIYPSIHHKPLPSSTDWPTRRKGGWGTSACMFSCQNKAGRYNHQRTKAKTRAYWWLNESPIKPHWTKYCKS